MKGRGGVARLMNASGTHRKSAPRFIQLKLPAHTGMDLGVPLSPADSSTTIEFCVRLGVLFKLCLEGDFRVLPNATVTTEFEVIRVYARA